MPQAIAKLRFSDLIVPQESERGRLERLVQRQEALSHA